MRQVVFMCDKIVKRRNSEASFHAELHGAKLIGAGQSNEPPEQVEMSDKEVEAMNKRFEETQRRMATRKRL